MKNCENSIWREDLARINEEPLPWKDLKGTDIVLTGATGLIGSTLLRGLLYANEKRKLGLTVYAVVRDPEKAKEMFGEPDGAVFLEGSMEALPPIPHGIDYVIHGACPTASAFMVSRPADVIRTSIEGTMSLLDAAAGAGARGFVFLSSMEAYGTVREEITLTEDILGTIDLSNVRSCYPESKRMCEMLCTSYAAQYGLRAMSVRLAQTFGPGIAYDDPRVFAMMARCALEGKDIVLATPGTSKRPYLYSAQAVTAILTVLLKGSAGETYNAANPQTYCSVFEMGQRVAAGLGEGKISVRVDEHGDSARYPAASYLKLSADKIMKLGWKPAGDLDWMYQRLADSMKT